MRSRGVSAYSVLRQLELAGLSATRPRDNEIRPLELITLAFFTTVWNVEQHPTLALLPEGVSNTTLNTLGKRTDEYLIGKFEFDGARIQELQAVIDERFIEYDSAADLALHGRSSGELDGPLLWRECGNLIYRRVTGNAVPQENNIGADLCNEFAAQYFLVHRMLSEYIAR